MSTKHARRGFALLLVMIAMVVAMILTAGFLASQGTAIGIARNERDQAYCRSLAESAIVICMGEVKANPNWRTQLPPGTWVNNMALGNGTVTVTAADTPGAAGGVAQTTFTADPTHAALFTATASYNGRTFTAKASIGPTGGGKIFGDGAFISGPVTIVQGADSSGGSSTIDVSGPTPNSSALSVNGASTTVTAPNVANQVKVPIVQFKGRTPGVAVQPNSVGVPSTHSSLTGGNVTAPGTYSPVVLPAVQASVIKIVAPASYTGFKAPMLVHVQGGDVAVKSYNLTVTGYAALIVDGNVSFNSTAALVNSSSGLIVYAGANTAATSSATAAVDITSNVGNSSYPSQVIIVGSPNVTAVRIHGTANVAAGIYAPQADVFVYDTASLTGSVVAKSLTINNPTRVSQNAKVKLDSNMFNVTLDTVYGGSLAPAGPDYMITWYQ